MKNQLEEFELTESLAPGWKKFLLGWIDVFIVVALAIALHFLFLRFELLTWFSTDIIVMTFGVLLVYRFICIYFIGSTAGMFFLNLKFLNGYEERLSKKERLLASFFIMINGTDYYKKNPS